MLVDIKSDIVADAEPAEAQSYIGKDFMSKEILFYYRYSRHRFYVK